MNNKNIKQETTISPGGVKKGLTTPVVPTINPQPESAPNNQSPSSSANQPVNQTSNSNDNK